MNTKKLGIVGLLFISIIAIASIVQAASITEPTTFRDRVMFRGSTGPDFDADNKFSIGQVQVTATAAQLNAAGAGAVTNGAIDTFVVTNLTAVTGFTAPTGSINAVTLNGHVLVGRLTNALAGTAFTTNTLTGDGVTNVFIWNTVGNVKVLKSITTTP
jgi:hypothetical protein